MQATTAQATSVAPASARAPARPASAASAYQGYQILRRNGAVVSFEPNKIAVALMKAFLAVHGTQGAASASVRATVDVRRTHTPDRRAESALSAIARIANPQRE